MELGVCDSQNLLREIQFDPSRFDPAHLNVHLKRISLTTTSQSGAFGVGIQEEFSYLLINLRGNRRRSDAE